MNFLSWCIAILLLAAACHQSTARDLLKSYDVERIVYQQCLQANNLNNSGRYEQACQTLSEAAKHDPTSYSADVHRALSDSYRGMKNYAQALKEAETALRYDPADTGLLYSKALILYDKGDYDRAVECLDSIIASNKDVSWQSKAKALANQIGIYGNLKKASDLVKAGQDSQAIACLEKAARFDPSNYSAQIHAMLCFAARRTGNTSRAIEEGKKALQFNPSDKDVAYNLSIAFENQANFDEAVNWLQRYLSLEPDAASRQQAQDCLNALQTDKKKQADPSNKLPDYLEHMDASYVWSQERFPLKIYISSGKDVFGYRSSFDNVIKRAFDIWCQASGKKLSYKLVTAAQEADIVVQWTADSLPRTDHHLNVETAGITRINRTGNEIRNAAIHIRTTDPFDRQRALQESECASVCVHEVGHALGLGHSNCIKDVMYFRSAGVQSGLPTARDKATIARLYRNYPGVGFVPVAPPETKPLPAKPLPPLFMPPKPPSDKLVPPLFLPPPLSAARQLQPPFFTPPPVSSSGSSSRKTENPAKLFFNPAPIKEKKENPSPPLFTPPRPKE